MFNELATGIIKMLTYAQAALIIERHDCDVKVSDMLGMIMCKSRIDFVGSPAQWEQVALNAEAISNWLGY